MSSGERKGVERISLLRRCCSLLLNALLNEFHLIPFVETNDKNSWSFDLIGSHGQPIKEMMQLSRVTSKKKYIETVHSVSLLDLALLSAAHDSPISHSPCFSAGKGNPSMRPSPTHAQQSSTRCS
jgi:hypothetical protein